METKPDLDIVSDQLPDRTDSMSERLKEDWKKRGRLLSGLIGSNVLLFSCALLTCVFNEDIEIFQIDFYIILCIMMIICILWMFFQMYFSWKYKNAILYKDCQAGPIWMRVGIILFGIGTLVMASFKIVRAINYLGCETPLAIVQPVVQAIFVIVQTIFLWLSCKHCVQIYINATRCFLMILLALNLVIWVTAVSEESMHHTFELQKYLMTNSSESEETSKNLTEPKDIEENANGCGCHIRCTSESTVFSYLYPFNIEYNLFAAAMLYIMWKNVGREIDDNASLHHGLGPGVRKHVPLLGLVSGLGILITGLVMFILYEIGREDSLKHWLSLTTFYIFHVASLGLMCLANVVGIIIFSLDKRKMDKQKNPSRTLDMSLLLGATLGQYAISYYSIIAMVSTKPFDLLCGLTLSYSALMIIQHSLQNAFIIEGLYRLPPNNLLALHENSRPARDPESTRQVTVQEADSERSLTRRPMNTNKRMSRRETLTMHLKSHLKKRKTMKDVYLFLFLCNIVFWIMPAFGARIRFDNGLEVSFYGFNLWAIITNICLPFGIFYRMHAAASLLELYSMS